MEEITHHELALSCCMPVQIHMLRDDKTEENLVQWYCPEAFFSSLLEMQ